MSKKYALCVNHPDEISDLIDGKVETISLRMVSREICEDPQHKLSQIIPYATFYSVDGEEGKLEILQYERPTEMSNGEAVSEERLSGMTSVGFGGHIDNEEDISFTERTEVTIDYQVAIPGEGDDEGFPFGEEPPEPEYETVQEQEVEYTLTLEQLLETIKRTIYREVEEEIGLKMEGEFDDLVVGDNMMFFKGKEPNAVNFVHYAAACLIPVSPERLARIKEEIVVNEDEIKETVLMGINFGQMLANFNLENNINALSKKLREEHSLEDWSRIVVESLLYGLCSHIIRTIDYPTLYHVHKLRVEQIQKHLEEQQNAEEVSEGEDNAQEDSSE